MTTPELLPCPFCGGEARLWPVIMPFDADCDAITVQCPECNAVGANVLVDQDVHDQSDLPSLEAEAIAAWNHRAGQAHAAGLLEALELAGDAINSAYMQADAEARGHDRIADRHDKIVRAGRDAIRAAIAAAKGADNSRIESVAMREAADHITALTAERDAAVAEVAQIVAWLRSEGETWYGAGNQGVAEIMQDAADAIAAGAHLEGE